MKNALKNLSKVAFCLLLFICTSIFLISCDKKSNPIEPQSLEPSLKLTGQIASLDPTVTNRLGPPSAVQASYSSSPNAAASDDFNGSGIDFTKWQYRTDGGSNWDTTGSNVYIATNGSDKFLTLKGSYPDKKGSGITAK